MNYARFGLIALIAPLLSACFDIDQTLRVSSETSSEFIVHAAVPASTIAAAQQYAGVAGRPFCADKDAAEKLGLHVAVETSTEGENQICRMRASGPLTTIAKVAADKSYLPKNAPSQAKALDYKLEREGEGLWRLTMTLTTPREVAMLAGTDEMTRAAQIMMFGSVEGRGITWGVEADEIVETNGTRSPDGTRAEYKLPLGDLLSKPQPEYRFTTLFRAQG